MVREYEAPVRLYKYPFELVMKAYHRRFPTCDLIPELLDTQVIYDFVSNDGAIQITERRFKLKIDAPYILKKISGVEHIFVMSRNSLNKLERTLLIECRNESFSSRVSAFETCKFMVSPDNKDHTIFTQVGCLEIKNFYGFESLVEKVMIRAYSKSLKKTEQLILNFINLLAKEGVTEVPRFTIPEELVKATSRLSVDEITALNPLKTGVVSTTINKLYDSEDQESQIISEKARRSLESDCMFKFLPKLTLLERNSLLLIHKKLRKRDYDIPNLSCVLRFLKASENNSDKAYTMLIKHLNWKRQNFIDSIHSWEIPKKLISYYKGCWHHNDLNGNPLYIMQLGSMDLKGFMKTVGPDGIAKNIVKICEEGIFLCEQATKSLDKLIISWSLLLDFYDFSLKYSWKPIVQTFLRLIEVLQANYPESLSKIIIVRAPKFFVIVWSLISAIITDETKKKFCIITDDCLNNDRLCEYIPRDYIPSFLGGSSKCLISDNHDHVTIPRSLYKYKDTFQSDFMGSISIEDMYKRVTVSKPHNVEVSVHIGQDECVITWDFDVLESDIIFCLYKVPKNYSISSMVNLVLSTMSLESLDNFKPIKYKEGSSVQGSYYCSSSGTYVLQWKPEQSHDSSKKAQIMYHYEILPNNELRSSFISLSSNLSNASGADIFSINNQNLSV